MQTVTFTEPDGFHVHVRDGELMRWVVPHTARRFARAIIMPNLNPPVESTEQARKYRERILGSVPSDVSFEPLMTLYLTEETPPNEIVTAKESGFVHGVKWYPAGATTNSQHGVQFIHEASPRVAGTITAHHLLLNRVAMFEGGLRPITTACRFSNVKNTVWRWLKRQRAGTHGSFLVRIALHANRWFIQNAGITTLPSR